MNTFVLGQTGFEVTELGFGGIPIIPLSNEEAIEVVKHCYEVGINFFDTANMYGDSEKKIGQALEPVRDKVYIATKTLARDAAGATEHIELSLKNLRTDYIDLFQLHAVSKPEELETVMAPGGAYEAVQRFINDGQIRHVGFSSHDIATAIKGCRTGMFASIQIPFNFIEHEPAENLFKAAGEENMGIIGMKPLGGGLLDRADLCFKFLRQYPNVIPIPGFSSIEEIDQVIALYEEPGNLTDQDQADIDRIRGELGKAFCHRCGYCGPCEQGVKITDVLMFRSMAQRIDPPMALFIGKPAMETVENCTDCGECLEKCPYNLPIPELLREYLQYYNELAAV